MPLTIFLALMLILAILDVKSRRLPNLIILPASLIAMIAFKTLIPALMTFCLAWLLYDRGFWAGGDVKLSVMVSAFMGFGGILALGLGIVIAKCYEQFRGRQSLPVAPFVFIALIVVKIVGHLI